MEMLRLDSSTVFGVNANQALMIVVAVLASLTLFIRHRFFPNNRADELPEPSVPPEVIEPADPPEVTEHQ